MPACTMARGEGTAGRQKLAFNGLLGASIEVSTTCDSWDVLKPCRETCGEDKTED